VKFSSLFQFHIYAKPPAIALPGTAICRKIKLKNFFDSDCVGECGVAPILSATHLFCHAVAQRGAFWRGDPFRSVVVLA